jgi:hypothetical protein
MALPALSNARETAIILVISSIGLTFDPSLMPWTTPLLEKSSTGVAGWSVRTDELS